MTVTPPLTIRAAEPRDVDGLTALANLPGVRYGTLRLPFTTRGLFEQRLSAGSRHHLIVGTIEPEAGDPEVVAHGALMPRGGRMAHVGEILLFVHDAHTGRGYGAAILDALLDFAENWLGLRRLELDVNDDNGIAIRLYEGRGFETEGVKRGDVMRDGALVDTRIMGRLRDAPARAAAGRPTPQITAASGNGAPRPTRSGEKGVRSKDR